MPIDVYCTTCQKKLRVPDSAVGKRVQCPTCHGVLSLPSDSKFATTEPVVSAIKSPALVEKWMVLFDDQQEHGPITRTQLDQWHVEGRLTENTQILKVGSEQWQWASDLYSDLMPTSTRMGGMSLKTDGAVPGRARKDLANQVQRRAKFGSPHIDYIAYLLYVLGAIGLVLSLVLSGYSIYERSHAGGHGANIARLVATIILAASIMGVLLSVGSAIAAYGLRKRAKWARILAVAIGALSLSYFPIGTAIGIWIFIVLMNNGNAKAFK